MVAFGRDAVADQFADRDQMLQTTPSYGATTVV
jgi:hypothetical protein